MNKAKNYYVNQEFDMVHSTGYHRKVELTEIPAYDFKAHLRIKGISYLNYGLLFELSNDKTGDIYLMNTTMFEEYIKKNNVYLEGEWSFYKQGCNYSIGLKPEMEGDENGND